MNARRSSRPGHQVFLAVQSQKVTHGHHHEASASAMHSFAMLFRRRVANTKPDSHRWLLKVPGPYRLTSYALLLATPQNLSPDRNATNALVCLGLNSRAYIVSHAMARGALLSNSVRYSQGLSISR